MIATNVIPTLERLSEGIAVFRPSGHLSLTEAIQLVKDAIAEAKRRAIPNLLVVGIDVEGFDPPGIPARHFMSREWALAGQGRVRLAVVIREEMIDPQKFGVAAARNFGLAMHVCSDEAEAVEWLRDGV